MTTRHRKKGSGGNTHRKAASDSVTGALRDLSKPDMSMAHPPMDVPGADRLGDHGTSIYTSLFRERTEWTLADLALLVQYAAADERIQALEAAIARDGVIIETKTTTKVHPGVAAIDGLRTAQRNCLRDTGLRQKDGHSAKTARSKAVQAPKTGDQPSQPWYAVQ